MPADSLYWSAKTTPELAWSKSADRKLRPQHISLPKKKTVTQSCCLIFLRRRACTSTQKK